MTVANALMNPLHMVASAADIPTIEFRKELQQARDDFGPDFQGFLEMKDEGTSQSNGCTALHYANQQGLVDKVRLLLEFGADPNAPKNNGQVPLHSDHCSVISTPLMHCLTCTRPQPHHSRGPGPTLIQCLPLRLGAVCSSCKAGQTAIPGGLLMHVALIPVAP